MRIRGWHIDGFGMFADCEVDDLPAGLTVLHGPNEAGKTTLVSFILGVLFGFPGGKKTPQYEPLLGGRHGGRVFVDTKDGGYTIERLKKANKLTLTLPDESKGTRADLEALLGHADRGLFRNIFAFSLHELESLATLQDDAVKERIFAAPAFGAGRSPREALKILEGRKRALLKPSASSVIGDLRRELKNNQSELQNARARALSYPKAVSDLDEAEGQVDRVKLELATTRSELSRYKTLIDAWPEWSRRMEDLNELQNLETPEGVSPEITNRLIQVREQIKERAAKLESAKEELARLRSRLGRVTVDDRLPPIADEAKKLYAEASSHSSDLQRLVEIDTEIGVRHQQVIEKIEALGPGWSKERVEAFDASIPTTAELSAWRERFQETQREVNARNVEVDELQKRLAETEEEYEQRETQLRSHDAVPTVEHIDTEEKSLRRLRASVVDAARAGDHVMSAEGLVDERKRASDEAAQTRPLGIPIVALVGVISVLLVASIGLLLAGEVVAGAGLFVVAVILGGLSVASNSVIKDTVRMRKEALDRAAEALAARHTECETLEQQILESASSLGFDGFPTSEEIEEHLLQLGRRRSERATVDGLAEDVETLGRKGRRLEEDLRTAKERLRDLQRDSDAANDDWQAWRATRGVPEALPPDLALELFPAIKTAKEAIADLQAAERHHSDIEKRIAGFVNEAAGVLEAAGMAHTVRGSALVAALENLHQAVLDDEKKRRDIKGLEQGIAGAARDVDEHTARLEEAHGVRQELFDQVGASTEDEFNEMVEKIKRRLELEKSVADRLRGIRVLMGRGEGAEAMDRLLETGELADWKERLGTAQERLRELEDLRDQAVEHRKEMKAKVAELEQLSDVAALEIQAESYREQLTTAIAEWKQVMLARSLIEKTLLRFEEEHQPQVVDRAAKLFERITGGKYAWLIAGEDALVAVTSDGTRIELINLSTGTVQKHYLSLRLRRAEECAARGTVLPLFMDDVLVNFDPERAEQVAGVIAEVSEQHQVLLFTCHPETRDLAKKADPDARVIELERFAG